MHLFALLSLFPWSVEYQVLFTVETLLIILPYSIPLALVGILESLLTAMIVDEMTDTKSNQNKENEMRIERIGLYAPSGH